MIQAIGLSMVAVCLLGGCAGITSFTKGDEKARNRDAESYVELAAKACRNGEMKGLPAAGVREQMKAHASYVEQAEAIDASSFSGSDVVGGEVRAGIKGQCPERMKKALLVAEKADAEMDAQDAAERQTRQARLDALRAELKGDRSRLFELLGEPFKFDGQLSTARYWQYAVSVSSDRGQMDCSVTYHFRGNKLARRELASFCTADPHPDTMSLTGTMTMSQ